MRIWKDITRENMRYALRNQNKIVSALGQSTLGRILKSLDLFFEEVIEVPVEPSQEEYPLLIINDAIHPINSIEFYVLDIKFDVVRLAFKRIN